MKKHILVSILPFFSMACSLWSTKEEPAVLSKKEMPAMVKSKDKDVVKFSENPNVGAFSDKKYRRSTRKSLEDESEVHSRAGSLWSNEGQSSYLFTQNKSRREGDLLNVKLEGAGKSQVETKVQVIKKLLARIEIPTPMVNPNNNLQPDQSPSQSPVDSRGLASVDASKKDNSNKESSNVSAVNNVVNNTINNSNVALKNGTSESVDDTPFSVETVSTRVVERLADGNYRVKGTQPFMIGKREYKVIVTGFVRPEDFSDDGISSTKLIDPQWDVVSLRRVMQ